MRLEAWLLSVENRVLVKVRIGRPIPTVRSMGERVGPHIIRIDPDKYAIEPAKRIGLASHTLDILRLLNESIGRSDQTTRPVPMPQIESGSW
jgi:hypothetical protein